MPEVPFKVVTTTNKKKSFFRGRDLGQEQIVAYIPTTQGLGAIKKFQKVTQGQLRQGKGPGSPIANRITKKVLRGNQKNSVNNNEVARQIEQLKTEVGQVRSSMENPVIAAAEIHRPMREPMRDVTPKSRRLF